MGIKLTLDDFQRISDRVPFIADLKPSGKYVMEDVHKVRVCVCVGGGRGIHQFSSAPHWSAKGHTQMSVRLMHAAFE